MDTINRQVVIIRPSKPFLDWLHSLPDPVRKDFAMDDLNRDSTVYLIPDYDNEDESLQSVYENFELFFEEQLGGWWTDESDWPKDVSLKTFKKWFDVEIHSMVVDLLD